MNKIVKFAAAALAFGFLATSAMADNGGLYGDDVVITPVSVSANTDVDASTAYSAVKRGKIVRFGHHQHQNQRTLLCTG